MPCLPRGRYNAATLAIRWHGLSIADVLHLTVEAVCEVFASEPKILRPLEVLRDIGLGYLRLGQPATELSGGEAQRIKLATELQRKQLRGGGTLYVLDEPTTGLHPADVDLLLVQLDELAAVGNTVVVVEHDMRVVAASTGSSTWVLARVRRADASLPEAPQQRWLRCRAAAPSRTWPALCKTQRPELCAAADFAGCACLAAMHRPSRRTISSAVKAHGFFPTTARQTRPTSQRAAHPLLRNAWPRTLLSWR